MRNRWSGLAPAVDAHLARWAISKRIHEIILPMFDRSHEGYTSMQIDDKVGRIRRLVWGSDLGARWMVFSRSYGLPDDNGVPSPAVIMDRSHDGITPLDIHDGATISGREQFTNTLESEVQGILMIRREFDMLDQAVTHYVSAEVVEEITWAAEDAWPEPLFETDLVSPAGFAVLEHPLQVVDLHAETGLPDDRVHVQVRAIGWHRHPGIMSPIDGSVGEGVTLFLYTTPDDYLNGYVQECKAIGIDREGMDWAGQADCEGPFLTLEVIPWRFGVEWDIKPDTEHAHIPGTVPSPVAAQRRWFFAFMRLMWQEIIVHRPSEDIKRADHRRFEHLAKRKMLLDYTVLRLRRIVDPDYVPMGTGTPLDHRVKVRAHWRRQWVRSLGPARLPDGTMDPMTHRLVWIESHWRGPEDGQIGAMHSATSVIR